MKKLPKLDIKYGRVIDPFFIGYSKNLYPEWTPPSAEDVKKKVLIFKEAWEKGCEKILESISTTTGLSFVREVFDVYVVSGTPQDMSDPIVIKSRYDSNEFILVLIHEFLHRILTLNKIPLPFPDETRTTQSHVYVFAILKFLYIEILNDSDRLEKYKLGTGSTKAAEYKRAWEIVDEKGHKELIQEIKEKAAL